MAKPRFVPQYLGYLLGQANYALYKSFEQDVKAAGLDALEWRVLAALHDSPPQTIGALAREVLSKQPTLTKLVQRMAARQWLSLASDDHDLRCTRVAITPHGLAVVKPLLRKARAHEAALLQTLTPTELQRLKDILSRLANGPAA